MLNLEKLNFKQSPSGFPMLEPCDSDCTRYIGFNYALTAAKRAPIEDVGIHFFLDDYQFERVWTAPERYVGLIRRFHCAMTPDFSLYTDMPEILQKYNHYRKQWIGAYWQAHCIDVIPTVSWSDKSSFLWCFEGIPSNGIVAVSSVGTQKGRESKMKFLTGYEKMMEALNPRTIVFYGSIPDECSGNIVKIGCFQDRFGGGK